MPNIAKSNRGLQRVGDSEIKQTRAMLVEFLNSEVRGKTSGKCMTRADRLMRRCLAALEQQVQKGNMDAIKYAMSMLAGSTDAISEEMNGAARIEEGSRVLGVITRKTTVETAEIRGGQLNGHGHGTAV